MLEKAIAKILSIAENQTYDINGETYSDKPLVHIPYHYDKPDTYQLYGLDGIAKMVMAEKNSLTLPLFIRITTPTQVDVDTTYRGDMTRDRVYRATADVPGFTDGYTDHNESIIRLRSRFAPNDGQRYLLELLSTMNMEQSAQSYDNGVTQTVTARQGISLSKTVNVKPIVKLAPYRTFHEVSQPESEFLLRIGKDGEVGLFEADGGAWKLEAKKNIQAYFEYALRDLIAEGKVVVTI